MSSDFSSRRSASSSVGFALTSALVSALVFSGAGCLKAHIFSTNDGGSGGTGGSVTGIGGGIGGDNAGVGGDEGVGGDIGTGDGGAGDGGAGGDGTGGTIGGTGGSVPDAGYDVPTGITPNAPGQLVITEIMADTTNVSDDSGEWFELYNPTLDSYDLFGCLLYDTSNMHQVARHVIVEPGAYVTLARFADSSGGFVPTYFYLPPACVGCTTACPANQCVKFGNNGDRTGVSCGGMAIDEVVFVNWLKGGLVPHGKSYSLDPSHYTATENDIEANWCTGTSSYSGTDLGTPGRMNPTCLCTDPDCAY